jgi:small subunit ribosomal protein S20
MSEDQLANSKSAEKRIRQERKRSVHNRSQRTRLKTAIKMVMNADSADTATAAYRETSGLLDRMATRSLIHRNKAARKKSQLASIVRAKGGAV